MSPRTVRSTFDAQYYERFYENPATRAATVHDATRQARFIAAYLRFLELPVTRIVDLGCGLGRLLRALGRQFPGARAVGVETSEFLCQKYGWVRSPVAEFRDSTPFDLVVCNDVVQYLDAHEATRAIANMARHCRGALVFGALTSEDWRDNCDRVRTDSEVHLRSTAWYRRRLARNFVNVGGGVYLKRPVWVPVWSLDRLG
jgi:SAM-dependent methyltransferase